MCNNNKVVKLSVQLGKWIHGNAWADDKIRASLGLRYHNYQSNRMGLKYALTVVLRLTIGPVPLNIN